MKEKEMLLTSRILEDELFDVWDSLDKAVLMISEVNDEYFRKYNKNNKDDKLGICWEFARNAKYMDIIDDYVYQAKKALEDLEQRRNELKGAI